MKIILLIGTGSFIGGIFRYLLSHLIHARFISAFPLGTLAVNILGCFLIGIVFGYADRGIVTHEWRLFLATGLLGGFTTFSAFSNETIGLFRDGQICYAIAYAVASVLFGLLATWAAYSIVEAV